MGDGSSKIPLFCGEDFMEWSRKMKKHLISKGVWSWVEEGVKDGETAEKTKQQVINNANALIIIQKYLSPNIFMIVRYAKTAKDAWDTLHHTFMPKETKMEPSVHRSKMKEPSVHRSKTKEVSADESSSDDEISYTLPDLGDDDEIKPLSGDKPFFNMVLTKSAVKPRFQLSFPCRCHSLLPSNNGQALVRLFGRDYEIKYYGSWKQKSFGSGWRQLVEDHKLKEGDPLVFEIMKCNDNKLEINMSLKSKLPPKLEREIGKRKSSANKRPKLEQETRKRKSAANKRKVLIDLPDSSASDEDKWY